VVKIILYKLRQKSNQLRMEATRTWIKLKDANYGDFILGSHNTNKSTSTSVDHQGLRELNIQ